MNWVLLKQQLSSLWQVRIEMSCLFSMRSLKLFWFIFLAGEYYKMSFLFYLGSLELFWLIFLFLIDFKLLEFLFSFR